MQQNLEKYKFLPNFIKPFQKTGFSYRKMHEKCESNYKIVQQNVYFYEWILQKLS